MTDAIVYKYKYRFIPILWLALLLPVLMYMLALMVSRHEWVQALIVTGVSLLFLLLMFWLLLQQVSDITLDDQGIGRALFGFVWQKIQWTNVERVAIFSTRSPEDGRLSTSYVFRATRASSNLVSNRLAFQDRKDGMDVLLNQMNDCITKHGISVVDLRPR